LPKRSLIYVFININSIAAVKPDMINTLQCRVWSRSTGEWTMYLVPAYSRYGWLFCPHI